MKKNVAIFPGILLKKGNSRAVLFGDKRTHIEWSAKSGKKTPFQQNTV
uniref:Uncharacterized protein n=1 Tax=Yersinia enterocolitica W22703 TaxID=913028 RepID=F4MYN5_YEREN|nr:unknown protein [Yersinia enterocolitica W22703]